MESFTSDGKRVEYNVEKFIKHGRYGRVCNARILSKNSDEGNIEPDLVALKEVKRKRNDEDEWSQTVLEYENRLKGFKHFEDGSLIRWKLDATDEQKFQSGLQFDRTIIVIQYCSGALQKEIYSWGLDDRLVNPYMKQILLGLSFLQKKGIIHADLKPSNILVQHLPKLRQVILKICDVEDSVILDEEKNDVFDFRGMAEYYSPEMAAKRVLSNLPQKKVTQKTDIWSVKSLMLNMIQGYKHPVIKNEKKKINLSNVKRCFMHNPKRKLNADELCAHYPEFCGEKYCRAIGSSKEKIVEIGDYDISPLFINEYYRDMRNIFKKNQGKNNYWKVIIIGRPNLRQLFRNVSYRISILHFYYAHDWNSELLDGIDLPNLAKISFFHCTGIKFRKGHWKLLPNLQMIMLELSSISEMQNNFLKEIKKLDYFDDGCGRFGYAVSILRSIDLLHSEDYGWYRSYRINTPQLKGRHDHWRRCASGECYDFSSDYLRLEKAIKNSEDMESKFTMAPFSFDDLLNQLKEFHPTEEEMGRVTICDGRIEIYISATQPIKITISCLFLPTTLMAHLYDLKVVADKISRLFRGHPLALNIHFDESDGMNWKRLNWESVWDMISPLQSQIISLQIEYPSAFPSWMMPCFLPNLLELELQLEDVQISSESFSGFPKLRALMIRTNTISSIHKDIFDGLKKLQHFHLRNCSSGLTIQEIKEFRWLRNKLQSDPSLSKKKYVGEVWEIRGNGHYYRNNYFYNIEYESDLEETILIDPDITSDLGQDKSLEISIGEQHHPFPSPNLSVATAPLTAKFARGRIYKDIVQMQNMLLLHSGISLRSSLEDGLSGHVIMGIKGVAGTIYEGEEFELHFRLTNDYPFELPAVAFQGANIPIHPDVYSNGDISFLVNDWTAVMGIESVCLSIVGMLSLCTEKKRPEDDHMYVSMANKNSNIAGHRCSNGD